MNALKPATLTAAALAAGLYLLPASPAAAQQPAASTPSVSAPAPAPGAPAGREDFRARMAERLKAQLKATDEEWAVIQPLLENTMEKLVASRSFGGPGAGGNPGGETRRRGGENNGAQPQAAATSPAATDANRQQRREGGPQRGGSPETQALRAAVEDDNATVNDIKAKLQAVRDQRKKAADELALSREELRKVLNMRQEAALVADGILD